MTDPHDWCWLTSYCLRCGAGAEDVFGDRREAECCADPGRVVAISAILARRRFAALMAGPVEVEG